MRRMLSCSRASAGRAACTLVVLTVVALCASPTRSGAEQAAKTVLVLYGQAQALPGIEILDDEIHAALATAAGPIQFYSEYLDDAWFPNAGVRRAILNVMREKYRGRRIDLIITPGPRALEFALNNRTAVFGGAPIVFVGGPPRNAAALPADVIGTWASPDWGANLDIILQLQPATKRVAVIFGTSAFERASTARMREAFAAYRGRLDFIELTDLPLADIVGRAAALEDGTVILFFTLLRDGAGANHLPTHAVETIVRTARVPVYGMNETVIGHGVVGGRVVSFRRLGQHVAALAAAALRGESAAEVAASNPDFTITMFDARQLARWELSEARVPPGSVIVNRQPSMVSTYRWYIAAGLVIATFEALLIMGLLVQRRRRAVAQEAVASSLRFERLVSEVSASLAAVSPDDVDAGIRRALRRILDDLGCDRAGLLEFTGDQGSVRVELSAIAADVVGHQTTSRLERYPWMVERLRRGEAVRFMSLAEVPEDAKVDRATFEEFGIHALVAVPLEVDHTIFGAITLAAVAPGRECPNALIPRLRLLGQSFSNALARRRADTTIRETELRFRIAADAAPIMMWMAGPDGLCTYFNRGWLDFTGRTIDEELGDGWASGVHPADRERCLDGYRRALEAHEPFTLEYRLRREDGEYRWISDHGMPRFAPDGSFAGYIGACTDLTESKAAHVALLENVALRSAIFGSLYGHVAAVDKHGVVVAVNRAWTEFAAGGWNTPRPPVGTNYLTTCEQALHAGAGAMATAVRDVLHGKRPRATVEYSTRSGVEERWFEMAVEPFQRPEGGVIVSHIDTTRRRRAEAEARRQRDELAHALRASTLGALAASLAHEINQPLAAITANTQAARLLLGRATGEHADLREALEDIGADARRAAQIIRRLRALFRKEGSEYKPTDINALIVEVTTLLHGELEAKGIGMQLSLANDLPTVAGDAIQLQQVILNVLVNAAEAMADLPSADRLVSIETGERHPGTVEITVRDTGPGVKEPEIERIFDPFVTTKRSGLGMGLSISRSIVQAHGGRMWATLNNPHGLTIHIELSCEEDTERQ